MWNKFLLGSAGAMGLVTVATATPTAIENAATDIASTASDVATSMPGIITAGLVIFGVLFAIGVLKRTLRKSS